MKSKYKGRIFGLSIALISLSGVAVLVVFALIYGSSVLLGMLDKVLNLSNEELTALTSVINDKKSTLEYNSIKKADSTEFDKKYGENGDPNYKSSDSGPSQILEYENSLWIDDGSTSFDDDQNLYQKYKVYAQKRQEQEDVIVSSGGEQLNEPLDTSTVTSSDLLSCYQSINDFASTFFVVVIVCSLVSIALTLTGSLLCLVRRKTQNKFTLPFVMLTIGCIASFFVIRIASFVVSIILCVSVYKGYIKKFDTKKQFPKTNKRQTL